MTLNEIADLRKTELHPMLAKAVWLGEGKQLNNPIMILNVNGAPECYKPRRASYDYRDDLVAYCNMQMFRRLGLKDYLRINEGWMHLAEGRVESLQTAYFTPDSCLTWFAPIRSGRVARYLGEWIEGEAVPLSEFARAQLNPRFNAWATVEYAAEWFADDMKKSQDEVVTLINQMVDKLTDGATKHIQSKTR